MQHILVHSKMNGLRPLLTAPPVFAFRPLRGDSKKCCRLLHYQGVQKMISHPSHALIISDNPLFFRETRRHFSFAL